MRKQKFFYLGCGLLMIFVFACTTKNIQDQKLKADASRRLGEEYLRLGKFRNALRELVKAEALYPDDYLLQDDLGLAYHYLGKQGLAISHFKKALEIKEDYAPARNNLGNAYAAQEDWDKAIEQYKIVSSDLIYATPEFPLSNLGFAYYQIQEYTLSEKYYKKALKVKPTFVNALHGLAKTYLATGQIAEAVARLEKAVKVSPKSAYVHFELANAYRMRQEYQKAYATYQKVVQLDPDSPLADQAMQEAHQIQNLF
ncbi:MAG: tetratricopeptide repeat protein [Desulfobacterales bacterium]|nr:tetratricopeptide repeat protein [Desulfobacterales bacterium]